MGESDARGLSHEHRCFFGVKSGQLRDSTIITCKTFSPCEATFSLLSRSPKFCPTPSTSFHTAILRSVRDFTRKLLWRSLLPSRPSQCRFSRRTFAEPPLQRVNPNFLRECRRLEASVRSCLQNCPSCYSASNLKDEERAELQRLCADASITILPADKGGKWVIVPSKKYEQEAYRQLSDTSRYRETVNDVDRATKQRLTVLLQHLRNAAFISPREFRALLPPEKYKPRRFFLLPKVHKSEWPDEEMPPGRPIVSDVDSVSRPCASFLEHFLAPIAQSAPSYLRDSHHLLALLQHITLCDNSLFFTMDVADLYNNIPIDEGVECVARAFSRHPDARRPDLTCLTMLRLLLNSNVFVFGSRRFLQLRGTPMGGAYSGSFATIYLADWEEKIRAHPQQPRLFLRYIDDIIGLWDHGLEALRDFHDFLNRLDNNIKVDLHFSREEIRFLDLSLYRRGNRIGHRIGFKPTDCHVVLSPDSHHPQHTFRGILFSQVLRWITKSSTYEDFRTTASTVTPVWRRQGYTRAAIRSAIKDALARTGQTPIEWETGFFPCQAWCEACKHARPTRTISDSRTNNVYAIHHRLTCSDHNIIYCITCTSCDQRYVGQTSRPLRRRIGEHLNDIKRQRETPISAHFNICGISFFSFTALERVPAERQRLEKEARWIERLHTTAPDGINVLETSLPSVNPFLILPHSACADRTLSLCRSFWPGDLTCAKRRSSNLRALFKRSVLP